MGTVHPVMTLLAVWTAVSVVLVGRWSLAASRQRLALVVVREPRSHVQVLAPGSLAPVVDLDARRSVRRSA